MDNEQIKENLRNMSTLSQSQTPRFALDRINHLENVIHKIAYWFNTDQEVLDTMSVAERNDHIRQHKMLLDAIL
jgi:hypothetical protein